MEYSKTEMVEAIQEHLSNQGRRLTNAKSATKDYLIQKITEYGIDIETFSNERKERLKREKKERAIKKKQEDIESKKRIEEYQKEQEELAKEREEIINKTSKIESLFIYRTRKAIFKELEDVLRKEEYEKTNERLTKETDIMEQTAKNDGQRVERIGPNRLNINGINIENGFYHTKTTVDIYIKCFSKIERFQLFGPLEKYGILDNLLEYYGEFIKGREEWKEQRKSINEEKQQIKMKEYLSKTIRCDTWGCNQELRVMHKDVLEFICNELTPEQILKINEFQLNHK